MIPRLIALLLLCSTALADTLTFPGSTISMAFTNRLGQQDTNAVLILPVKSDKDGKPIVMADGSVITVGPKILCPITPTNIALANGNYMVTNAVLGQGIVFAVPNDPSGTYTLGYAALSGFNTYNYTPGVKDLTAGPGIVLSATKGSVTISANGNTVTGTVATSASPSLVSQPAVGILGIDNAGHFTTNSIVPGLAGAQSGSAALTNLANGDGSALTGITAAQVGAQPASANLTAIASGNGSPITSGLAASAITAGGQSASNKWVGSFSGNGTNIYGVQPTNANLTTLASGDGSALALNLSRGTNFQKSQLGLVTNSLDLPESYFIGASPTPPMMWNSWVTCNWNVAESNIVAAIDTVATNNLNSYGWNYVVIDDGWSTSMNANGVLVPDATRFPSGIPYLAKYAHDRGVKLGIYTELGTNTDSGHALATREFYATNAQTFASWGVDFVKFHGNWMIDEPTSWQWMQGFTRTLASSGRPIVTYSINPSSDGSKAWRVDNAKAFNVWYPQSSASLPDGDGSFSSLMAHFDNAVLYRAYISPGHFVHFDGASLNTTLQAQMTVYALLSASFATASYPANAMQYLTNSGVISVWQDPAVIPAYLVTNIVSGGVTNGDVWCKPLGSVVGSSKAVGLINRTASPLTLSFKLQSLGLPSVPSTVYDLWGKANAGFIYSNEAWSVSVPASNVVFYKVTTGITTASTGTTVWKDAHTWSPDSGCTALSQANQGTSPVSASEGFQILGSAATQYIYVNVPGYTTNITGTIYCGSSVDNSWTITFQGFTTPPGSVGRWLTYSPSASNVVVSANQLVAVPFTVNFDAVAGHEADIEQIRMVIGTGTNATGSRYILGPAKLVCQ